MLRAFATIDQIPMTALTLFQGDGADVSGFGRSAGSCAEEGDFHSINPESNAVVGAAGAEFLEEYMGNPAFSKRGGCSVRHWASHQYGARMRQTGLFGSPVNPSCSVNIYSIQN